MLANETLLSWYYARIIMNHSNFLAKHISIISVAKYIECFMFVSIYLILCTEVIIIIWFSNDLVLASVWYIQDFPFTMFAFQWFPSKYFTVYKWIQSHNWGTDKLVSCIAYVWVNIGPNSKVKMDTHMQTCIWFNDNTEKTEFHLF